MMKRIVALTICLIIGLFGAIVKGGPYREAGVCAYIGPDHRTENPVFRNWATDFNFGPAPGVGDDFNHPALSLEWATGDVFDIVSLGDIDEEQIADGVVPGWITLSFGNSNDADDPNHIIRDVNGYDFVVFENGFHDTGYKYFCDFGYVEVSSNGVNFARFPSVSLTSGSVWAFGSVDITGIYNLAGKHPNGYGICTGTPFDLSEIRNEPNVVAGLVDVNSILYVRIVDIPGSGDFYDNAHKLIDPCTWPGWDYYDVNHPIYDAWVTIESGGFDLEAIGVLKPQEYGGDINLDGVVDYEDLEIFAQCWMSHFGQDNFLIRCDLAGPKDLNVNLRDFAEFTKCWRKVEHWRGN